MFRILTTAFLTAGLFFGGFSQDLKAENSCGGSLGSLSGDNVPDEYRSAYESFDIMDLVSANPETNLAVRFPSLVMNAAQRIHAMFQQGKPYSITDPVFRVGEVTIYPVFEGANPFTSGRMIVGGYDAKSAVANHAESSAAGDGSTAKLPVLTGPSGTGKTEFIQLLDYLSGNLISDDPNFRLLTFEWFGLDKVSATKVYAMLDDQGNELPRPSELQRSPFVLLPHRVQDAILQLAAPKVIELGGYAPKPVRTAGPQSADILKRLIRHYTEQNNGKPLTENEILNKVLKNHVRVVHRRTHGEQMFVKLGAHGRDVPYNELFFSPNPFNAALYGPGEPMSYHFNGRILAADGGMLVFDELYRNSPEFRDAILDLIEDGVIQRGGSPAVVLDALILAATNDESIEASRKKATSNAQRDRSRHVAQRRSIHPIEIQKTLLLMKKAERLRQKKLKTEVDSNTTNPSWEDAKLLELFPLPTENGYQGPQGRFAISFKGEEGEKDVFVAPHTLELMSYVVAASRFKTDAAEAKKLGGGYKVIGSAVFQNPIDRLKFLSGDLQITPGERKELKDLHYLLHEGDGGISQRDAALIWLTTAVERAATAENDYTLTPQIVIDVFLELLDSGEINWSNNKERLDWQAHVDPVVHNFLVPWIRADVLRAMSSGDGAVEKIYDVVRLEILALANDEDATEIMMNGRQKQAINFTRLEEISKAYANSNGGRPLVPQEVMNFHADPSNPNGRHRKLFEAILSLQANKTAQLASFNELSNFAQSGQGHTQVSESYSKFRRIMIEELGYNDRSVQIAFQIVHQDEARRAQLERERK